MNLNRYANHLAPQRGALREITVDTLARRGRH